MEILIGLVLGVALLWLWLIGHWFGRALVFIPLAVLGFVAGCNAAPTVAVKSIMFGLIGGAAAWFISGLPIYYWRHKIAGMVTPEAPWHETPEPTSSRAVMLRAEQDVSYNS